MLKTGRGLPDGEMGVGQGERFQMEEQSVQEWVVRGTIVCSRMWD